MRELDTFLVYCIYNLLIQLRLLKSMGSFHIYKDYKVGDQECIL
jgi:hypothetical protein